MLLEDGKKAVDSLGAGYALASSGRIAIEAISTLSDTWLSKLVDIIYSLIIKDLPPLPVRERVEIAEFSLGKTYNFG